MQCPQCNAPLEEGAVFCGNCGRQLAPLRAQGATVSAQDTQSDSNRFSVARKYGSPPSLQTPAREGYPQTPVNDAFGPDSPTVLSSSSAPSRPQRLNVTRLALIAALVLVVIAGGTIALVSLLNGHNGGSNPGNVVAGAPTGLVRFIDSANNTGHTDSLSLTISSLAPPPQGSVYDAWLVNNATEQITPLGTLTASNQSFTLNHTGNGTNLLGLADTLEITQEQGQVHLPTGKVVLKGSIPPLAGIHIRHLLLAFPTTPNHVGLLVGLLDQTQKLDAQAQILRTVAASGNIQGIQCVTQSMIDIMKGVNGTHYQPLPAFCAAQNVTEMGDGFGLLGPNGYLTTAAQHASLAATQTDSTGLIRTHAGHVQICITNITNWLQTVEKDAVQLLANPHDSSHVQEMVTFADHAYHGVDTNGDESIDPVPGEGGAITAYAHGQLMATIVLAPPNS